MGDGMLINNNMRKEMLKRNGYWVITRVIKGKKYATHFEPNKIRAIRSARMFRRKGIRTIITKYPKSFYRF